MNFQCKPRRRQRDHCLPKRMSASLRGSIQDSAARHHAHVGNWALAWGRRCLQDRTRCPHKMRCGSTHTWLCTPVGKITRTAGGRSCEVGDLLDRRWRAPALRGRRFEDATRHLSDCAKRQHAIAGFLQRIVRLQRKRHTTANTLERGPKYLTCDSGQPEPGRSRHSVPNTRLVRDVGSVLRLWRGGARQGSPNSRCRSCAGLPQTSGT